MEIRDKKCLKYWWLIMASNIQGGSLANQSGKIFEEVLIPLFKKHGYFHINEKITTDKGVKKDKYSKEQQESFKNSCSKYFITNAPYITIYKHKGKTEYLLVNKELGRTWRIECKWQQSAGSVDEKFPYLYLSCIEAYEEQEIILIIDGEGQKKGSLEWLKSKIDTNWLNDKNKTIRLMKLNEFIIWFNDLHKY